MSLENVANWEDLVIGSSRIGSSRTPMLIAINTASPGKSRISQEGFPSLDLGTVIGMVKAGTEALKLAKAKGEVSDKEGNTDTVKSNLLKFGALAAVLKDTTEGGRTRAYFARVSKALKVIIRLKGEGNLPKAVSINSKYQVSVV